MNRKKKRINHMKNGFRKVLRPGAALSLIAALSICAASPAMAYVTAPRTPEERGKTLAELNGFTEQRWQQLMDNRLEYEEIGDLVHTFNPAIVSAWSNLTDNTKLMDKIVDELDAGQRDMERLKSNAKSEGDYGAYGNYAMQEAILKLQEKFGKNAVLKGMNLEEGATTIQRNNQIGGHKAE